MRIDSLDVSLIELFTDFPGIGVMECSKRLGIARGTVQNRLNRLHESGVITRIAPQIDATAMGYPVAAFCSLQIQQNLGHDGMAEKLAQIPEILELHTVSGSSDFLVKIVARSTPTCSGCSMRFPPPMAWAALPRPSCWQRTSRTGSSRWRGMPRSTIPNRPPSQATARETARCTMAVR